ncbi:MAG: aminotransferase class I/II-fold pyridoxal phosphate-dependent enzyme [Conexibacter sp.]|nr:aminotransferase class I/II-fold pyridoxal phosphate-dependent enzyme [Conexibacter sp.]
MSLRLVIGGTRSGKSAHAERIAHASGAPVRYVATADESDRERIARHVARRPAAWETVTAGSRLIDVLTQAPAATCVLLDGLGPWIATALHRAGAFDGSDDDAALARVREETEDELLRFAHAAAARPGLVVVVAEECGHGVLPADRASRLWVDLVGDATQRLAAVAERVELVVAGRVVELPAPAAPAAQPAPSEFARLRSHGDTAVRAGDADHAVSVRAGGPPAWLRDALRRALDDDVARYPDEQEAVAALAALHGREPAEIVPANGAAEALWLLPAALRPALAACVHPGFTEAEAALRAHRVPVVRVLRDPQRDFALDPAAVPDGADLVIVGNPASPSGTLDPAAAVLALRRPGRVVVVDEAFMDLVAGEPEALVRERRDDVIVVRSLTKSLAIPGLRAGYAVAPPPLAERLRDVRPPWTVNAVALAALTAFARRPDALVAAAATAAQEREDLAQRLACVTGVRSWPAAANFVLIEVDDGAAVAARLRERRIAVREASSFPGLGAGHLRLTARTAQENARLVAALAEAVAACG